jgi:chemotaxis protein methyltransferase CheR
VPQDWTDAGLAAIAREVERQTGLSWPAGRRDSAEAAIHRAMERARIGHADRYLALIREETAAREELIAELTIGETYFLRDTNQFAALRDVVIPGIAAEAGRDRELRVWSAGCASGEEAYSLAIVLAELGLGARAWVLGTDIARHRLATARAGRYTRWSLRGVPPATVRRYFREDGRRYHLDPVIRDAVEFRYLNLAEDRYPSLSSGIWGMDLILCRNVLIYFDRETVARVAARLIASLSETGWLMLGASDPPIAEYVDCEVVVVADGILYRRADVAGRQATRVDFASAPHGPTADDRPTLDALAFDGIAADGATLPGESLAGAAERADVEHADAERVHAERVDAERVQAERVDAERAGTERATSERAVATPADSARAAYHARDYAHAAELAAAATAGSDDVLDAWVVRVRALANLGRLHEAGRVCTAALDRHVESAELHYMHAVLLVEAGRPAEAATAARQALYLDRGLIVAHLALADAATRAGDAGGAVRRSLRNAARLLDAIDPAAEVPASDGETAGRLGELVRMRLQLVEAA